MTIVTVLRNRFPQISNEISSRIVDVVNDTCSTITQDVQDGMAFAHSGRIYGNHQASAPGEMPAIDLSNLVNSIQIEPATVASPTGFVYTNVEYSVHLEYGAPAGNLAPRPFFTPTAEANREPFIAALRRALNDL